MQSVFGAELLKPAASTAAQTLAVSALQGGAFDDSCVNIPGLPARTRFTITSHSCRKHKSLARTAKHVCADALGGSVIDTLPIVDNLQCDLFPERLGHTVPSVSLKSLLSHTFVASSKAGDFTLSTHDLFHGHIVWNEQLNSLLIVLHAREYPRFDSNAFAINLGACQANSDVDPSEKSLSWRNSITAINASNSHIDGVIVNTSRSSRYWQLVPDGIKPLHTIPEEALGTPLVDVYFMHPITKASPRLITFPRLGCLW